MKIRAEDNGRGVLWFAGPLRGRWYHWLTGLMVLVLVSITLTLAPQRAHADPAQTGSWTAPFNVGVVGIHSQVLPNGKVLLWSYPKGTTSTKAVVLDPSTQTFTPVNVTYPRDGFCSGNDLLPDGDVFNAGGHQLNGTNPQSHEDGLGSNLTDTFDPSSQTWTQGPNLAQARWYPTNVELGNGNVLIFSGQVSPTTKATTVEQYDSSAGTMSTLPSTADKSMPVYPRMTLLPSGKILNSEPNKGTQTFNPATNTWSWVGNTKFAAARNEGSTVQLADPNKVLIAGGRNGTTGATNTAEIIDMSQKKPAWQFTASMANARAYANGVLLADGTVLEVGGGTGGAYTSPVKTAELYNPDTGTWSTMADQTAPRIYHSTAVLLPSGQVLSAGMDNGTYQNTAEIYSPPYLFNGPRPTISSAPNSAGYGSSLDISTPDAAGISKVALVKPAGATHAMGQDQKYVPLSFTHTSGTDLTATAPADGNHAPPGWYMLFIVNSSGVPSVASWVHVG